MKTPTHITAGTHAVAAASRLRVADVAYRSAFWSIVDSFGCNAPGSMDTGHKTTRARPLEPSQ